MSKIRSALLLAPMSSELRPLLRHVRARRTKLDELVAYTGTAGQVEVAIVRIGVGPDSARRVTERALARFDVDHVLLSGIAGGLDPELVVGSVVVPERVIDLRSGQLFDSFPLADVVRRGLVATADHLISDPEALAELQDRGVVAMEMESSGVAVACRRKAKPWTTFRAVGDRPDEGLTDDAIMSLLRPDGTSDLPAAIRLLLRHPNRIPDMYRLGRDASKAATHAARRTLAALGRASAQ